jgi:hypothetical protein
MTDDREALFSENHRLRNANRWWKAIAIAALALVFLVMCPFTVVMNQAIQQFGADRYAPKITTVRPAQPPQPSTTASK